MKLFQLFAGLLFKSLSKIFRRLRYRAASKRVAEAFRWCEEASLSVCVRIIRGTVCAKLIGSNHQPPELFAILKRVVTPHQQQEEIAWCCSQFDGLSPNTLVEIGTAEGGNHLLLNWSLPSVTKSIALDLRVQNRDVVRSLLPASVEFVPIDGDSSGRETIAAVQSALQASTIDCLFVDGDHSLVGVCKDLMAYLPLISEGGMIALHDINGACGDTEGNSDWAGEVPSLWKKLKAELLCQEAVLDPARQGYGIGIIRVDAAARHGIEKTITELMENERHATREAFTMRPLRLCAEVLPFQTYICRSAKQFHKWNRIARWITLFSQSRLEFPVRKCPTQSQ